MFANFKQWGLKIKNEALWSFILSNSCSKLEQDQCIDFLYFCKYVILSLEDTSNNLSMAI